MSMLLGGHSHALSRLMMYGCFNITTAEQLQERLYGLQDLKYLFCGSLQKNVVDPAAADSGACSHLRTVMFSDRRET